MQVVLAMFKSDGDRRSFSLHKDLTVIGRREDCDLRIPLGEISRKHCRLIKDGDSLRLEDLGSSNGTFHNGQRIVQEASIQPGDTIQVGSIAFVVQIDGVPEDDAMHPIITGAVSHDDSGVPVAAPSASGNGNGETATDAGDFDPMAVLESGDSQVPADALALDLEQSHHGQNASA